jgi:hypothetical protein
MQLEIKHEAKQLGERDQELGPTWTTRGFETRVIVHDQQTIVLTGMTQDRETTSLSKVPLLGDIPVLGHLFKYTTRSPRRGRACAGNRCAADKACGRARGKLARNSSCSRCFRAWINARSSWSLTMYGVIKMTRLLRLRDPCGRCWSWSPRCS